MTSSRH